MKTITKFFVAAVALFGVATAANAKNPDNTNNNVSPDTEQVSEPDMNVYGANYTDGDKFDGLTRKVGFDRMIPPHALEVCYNKTTHNVKFAKEPLLLSIEMTDFLHDGEAVNRPNNAQEIFLERLGSESPMLVKLIMKSIYKQNKREIKHIGSKRFGVQFLLKSIYTNNGLLYFHTELKNTSNIAYDIDYVSFKIVDKKVIKRTAMQEQVLEPLRAQNYVTVVHGKSSERTVFALEKFTIPDDKQLVIEIAEKEGGRHQSFVVDNEDIVRANVIDELSIQ